MERYLTNGAMLNLKGIDGHYIIKNIIGRGSSCVVYSADFYNNNGEKTEHLLKEFNPRCLDLERVDDILIPTKSEDQEIFNSLIESFKEGFDLQSELRSLPELKNYTANIQNIYHDKGTVYIDMTETNGNPYSETEEESILNLAQRIKVLAQVIGYYHKNGYLHLDIKPGNVFVRPKKETCQDVLLFDFDSLIPFREENGKCIIDRNVSVSYTAEYAPIELISSIRRDRIGKATDIYEIGEIFFEKLMRRHSTALEHNPWSSYDYPRSAGIFTNANPKVYPLLDELFQKTLCNNSSMRYQSTDDLIICLDKIIELSNPKEPFLKSSLPNVAGFFTGRDSEIEEIHQSLQENNVLFLSGIGGIGKSELAKHYAKSHKGGYDAIIFAPFLQDIQTMVANDSYVQIHNFFQYPEEKPDEYFERKMKELAKLCNERTLIIVDNFDTTEDENLDKLLSLNCKMLITTRRDFSGFNKQQLYVDKLRSNSEIRKIFDTYYKVSDKEESACVDEIIELVEGHTMTVELIAKQIEAEWATANEILDKLKESGISGIGESHVDSGKDSDFKSKSTYDHIKTLFDLSVFKKTNDENALYILANLSLVPHSGIDGKLFAKWCELDKHGGKNCVNILIKGGWIREDRKERKTIISLHPVVAEMIVDSINNSDVWRKWVRLFRLNLICREWSADSQSEISFIISCLYRMLSVFKKERIISEEIVYFLRDIAQYFSEKLYDHNSAFISITAARNKIKKVKALKVQDKLEIQADYGVICDYLGSIKQDTLWHKTAIDAYIEILSNKNIEMMSSLFVASIQQSLACAYDNTGDLQNAIRHFEYAIALLLSEKESKDTFLELFRVYNNIGIAYRKRKQFDMAISYYNKAFDVHSKFGVDTEHFAKLNHDIGVAMFYSDSYTIDEAKSYAEASLRLRRMIWEEESYYVAMSKALVGKIYAQHEDSTYTNQALTLLQEALAVYQKTIGNSHKHTAEISELINKIQT